MASKTEETPQKEEMPEKGGPETLPHDLSSAAITKLIRSAKKRGYVTHDQINSVLPSEEVNSEQIEDVLAMFREMGVNVVETQETSKEGAEPREEEEEPREEADEEGESEGGDLVEVQQKVPAKAEAKDPTERTDDPVRMYLREMSPVKLLSREGEMAIAKRIEAGREAPRRPTERDGGGSAAGSQLPRAGADAGAVGSANGGDPVQWSARARQRGEWRGRRDPARRRRFR
jgi:RNA polymerase primary sigma factor